jgi:thermitase
MKHSWLRFVLLPAALVLLLWSAPAFGAAPPGSGVSAAGSGEPPQSPAAPSGPYVAGELLVGFRPGITGVESAHAAIGAVLLQVIGQRRLIHRVRLPRSMSIDSAIAAYRKDPRVAFAEPNFIAHLLLPPPNDPSYSNGNQWAPQKIQALEAWALFPNTYYTAANKPSNALKVAVIDTGVDYTHADFINAGGSSSDASQGGQIDRADGYNFVNNSTDPLDDHGHGTHVAGILGAAANNGTSYTIGGTPQGIVGIGYPAQIMPIKVLDASGFGSYSNIATGIIRAADRGALVINLSLGGTAFSQTMQDAVNYAWSKGSLVVAAAGNSGNGTPLYPAACNFALAVASSDQNDQRSGFSSFGNWVGIAAPGSGIYSTLPSFSVNAGLPLFYGSLSGTSMATPHVAGLAALYAAAQGITQQTPGGNAAIIRAIQKGADNVAGTPNGGWSPEFGYGRINALRTLGGAALRSASVGSLTGAVNDLNNQAVSGATVSAGGRQAVSGVDGTYRIANLAFASYTVTASASGLTLQAISVTVPAGADVNATFSAGAAPPPPITSPVSTWYFAEGSTQTGFTTYLLMENPNATSANVNVTYYKESGAPVLKHYVMRAASRMSVLVNSEVPNSALSMKVESDASIFAERAMYIRLDGHASHGIALPSQTWYFAEGSTAPPFQTWILLMNPNATSANVTLSFMGENGGTPVVRNVNVAAHTRMNIYANQIVPNAAIATTVVSDLPIVAERSMYFGSGSHGSTGVTQPGTQWYLAEGFTGGGADTWVLLANPGTSASQATVRFMQENGAVTTRSYNIAPHTRLNIYANQIVPNVAFATQVTATLPIVAERAMYFGPSNARGGHNSEAASQPAQTWNLAEGSTQPGFTTFILVLNPGDTAASISLRFLQEAAAATVQNYSVAPHSRFTLMVNQVLPGVAFSTIVSSDQPVVVERVMYFNNMSGGTAALGIPSAQLNK